MLTDVLHPVWHKLSQFVEKNTCCTVQKCWRYALDCVSLSCTIPIKYTEVWIYGVTKRVGLEEMWVFFATTAPTPQMMVHEKVTDCWSDGKNEAPEENTDLLQLISKISSSTAAVVCFSNNNCLNECVNPIFYHSGSNFDSCLLKNRMLGSRTDHKEKDNAKTSSALHKNRENLWYE